jgi:hypothetical protein
LAQDRDPAELEYLTEAEMQRRRRKNVLCCRKPDGKSKVLMEPLSFSG